MACALLAQPVLSMLPGRMRESVNTALRAPSGPASHACLFSCQGPQSVGVPQRVRLVHGFPLGVGRDREREIHTERGMLCSWEQEIMILSTHEDMIAREYQNAKRIVPKFVLWKRERHMAI